MTTTKRVSIGDIASIADISNPKIGEIGYQDSTDELLIWTGEAWYTCKEYCDWWLDACND